MSDLFELLEEARDSDLEKKQSDAEHSDAAWNRRKAERLEEGVKRLLADPDADIFFTTDRFEVDEGLYLTTSIHDDLGRVTPALALRRECQHADCFKWAEDELEVSRAADLAKRPEGQPRLYWCTSHQPPVRSELDLERRALESNVERLSDSFDAQGVAFAILHLARTIEETMR